MHALRVAMGALTRLIVTSSFFALVPAYSQDNQLAAVRPRTLRASPACTACQIQMRKVATLASNEFEVETVQLAVARNSAGILLVGGKNGTIGIFGQSGKLLRVFGRRGAGPGEFQSIWQIYIGRLDSVFVYDLYARRITVLDPELKRAVRTFNFNDHRGWVALMNGSFLTSGSIATVRNSGLSLHLVSPEGNVLQSAGADSAVFRGQPMRRLSRSLAPLSDGSVIAAPTHRYRLEQWTAALNLTQVFERNVDWFPPVPEGLILDIPSRSPLPMQLMSVTSSGRDGIVITGLLSGSRNFKPDPALSGRTGEISVRESGSGPSLNTYVDTTIEFIDLKSASILATGRYPGFYLPINQASVSGRSALYCIAREATDGEHFLEIVEFHLDDKGRLNPRL